jgi:flagellum-specific peptidoglycan hydrolase FlgJ
MNFRAFLFTLIIMSFTNIRAMNFLERRINVEYNIVNYENLYRLILFYDIKFPEVVFAQAILESNHFESDLFKKHKNLFGMKHPNLRQTTSEGKTENGYASYVDWTNSIKDYQIWQKNNMKSNVNSQEDYLKLLIDRSYAEDKNYTKKLKSLISIHKKILDSKQTTV